MEGEECEEEEQEVQDSPDSAPLETSCQSMQELRLDEHKLLKEEELVEVKEEENIEGEDGDSRSPQAFQVSAVHAEGSQSDSGEGGYVLSAYQRTLSRKKSLRRGVELLSYVNINPTLCDCLLEKSEYKEVEKLKSLADLFSRTFIRMQACHEVLFPGQPPVVKKGQMEPIDITVASRGSNKRSVSDPMEICTRS
ncbi:eukaryotic translation initiation factor 2D-like [Cyprinus carpio]|uniref:Eukaryotic translation initiation factor 2D-like n=1 Tax=Cyprinus carpio TaxID=7962 RepID=A0A9Q9ZHD0_CYPCA|nr:eukaryotic translation initiation factor 2D-like [Cyprinus carpio]